MEFNFGTLAGIAVVVIILTLLVTGRKKKEVVEETAPEAPYKVEPPVVNVEVDETVVSKLETKGIDAVKEIEAGVSAAGAVADVKVKKPRAAKVGEKAATKAKAADKKPAAKKAPAKQAPAKAKKASAK